MLYAKQTLVITMQNALSAESKTPTLLSHEQERCCFTVSVELVNLAVKPPLILRAGFGIALPLTRLGLPCKNETESEFRNVYLPKI